MALDAAVHALDLLDPSVWISPETMIAGLTSVGRHFVKGRIQAWFDEIRVRKEMGQIDEQTLSSDESAHSVLELAKFLGENNPDIETWNAAKKIFMATLEKGTKDPERAALYELLNICKELSGTEIKIVAAAFKILRAGTEKGHSANEWASNIAKELGLETEEEVLRYEDNLVRQQLIMPREVLNGNIQRTWSAPSASLGHRLTKLGYKFAERLSQ